MDKDRIQGSFKQMKGGVKNRAGQLLGDQKMQAEGSAERAAGKFQNTIGGIKDSMRESTDK